MKILTLLCVIVLLTGCTTVPVARKFPDVPKELTQTCADLKQTQDTKKLSDVLSGVVQNYGQYHECKLKADTWIDWYNTQKKIFESVK